MAPYMHTDGTECDNMQHRDLPSATCPVIYQEARGGATVSSKFDSPTWSWAARFNGTIHAHRLKTVWQYETQRIAQCNVRSHGQWSVVIGHRYGGARRVHQCPVRYEVGKARDAVV